jgi:hypothetical protein
VHPRERDRPTTAVNEEGEDVTPAIMLAFHSLGILFCSRLHA